MNKDIAIYGAGNLGREIACLLNKINLVKGETWNLIGFFDDTKPIGDQISHFGVNHGGIAELNNWKGFLNIIICCGSPKGIKKIRENIIKKDVNYPNIIDPDFYIADVETFSIGQGNIIQIDCSVSTNISIGNFNLLNGWVKMGHDVNIGNFNVLMPGVTVSGNVRVGETNLLGGGCFIKEKIQIGNEVTISPLSALLTKPKDNSLYMGNPAKLVKF